MSFADPTGLRACDPGPGGGCNDINPLAPGGGYPGGGYSGPSSSAVREATPASTRAAVAAAVTSPDAYATYWFGRWGYGFGVSSGAGPWPYSPALGMEKQWAALEQQWRELNPDGAAYFDAVIEPSRKSTAFWGMVGGLGLTVAGAKAGGSRATADPVASELAAAESAAVSAGDVASSTGKTFVTTSRGTTYDIPEGWVGRTADNGKGAVYQRPGATGNVDMIRIMEPTPKYPNGYARVYNSHGQPVDVFGKPGPPATTHIPEDYVGPWPGWPGQ